VEVALRTELAFSRRRRRATFVAAATLAGALVLVPGSVSAEGLFDFLFGTPYQPYQANQIARSNQASQAYGYSRYNQYNQYNQAPRGNQAGQTTQTYGSRQTSQQTSQPGVSYTSPIPGANPYY